MPNLTLPSGTALIPGFSKTFGLVFIAIIVAAFLTGILTLQSYLYYSLFPNDPLYYKIAIAGVFILNMAHFISSVDFAWWYLVRNWGNVNAIGTVRISYGLTVVFGSMLIFLIQLLFMKRIYSLDKRLIYFVVPMLVLICVEFGFGILGASYGLKPVSFQKLATPNAFAQAVVAIWLGSGVIVDLGIAVVLSFSLHFKRTGLKRTDSIITKLILYTINTCVLTSVAAILDLITFYRQAQLGETLFLCYMLLCGIFSNSLLASFNRRAAFHTERSRRAPAVSTGLIIENSFSDPNQTSDDSYQSQTSPDTTTLRSPKTPTAPQSGHWDVELRSVSPPHGHYGHHREYSIQHLSPTSPVDSQKPFLA